METYEKINLADYFQAAVHALQVAAENKHLIGLQLRYHVRGIIRTLYSRVRSPGCDCKKAIAPFTRSTRAL